MSQSTLELMSRGFTSTLLLAAIGSMAVADSTPKSLVMPREVQEVISNRCLDCHGHGTSEGNVRFDNLASLSIEAQLELLNKAQDQLFFGLMPPDDAEKPSESERALLAGWLRDQLQAHHASRLDEKLRYPDYGNYVDHKQLFSGEIKQKG